MQDEHLVARYLGCLALLRSELAAPWHGFATRELAYLEVLLDHRPTLKSIASALRSEFEASAPSATNGQVKE